MADIKPFKAIHYNPEKIKNLKEVVCPPYDVISPEQQNEYHKRNLHNFIRISLGKDNPKDNEIENKYTRAKTIYEEWLRDGTFIEDQKPCIYYCKQEYSVMGEKHSRLGFVSLMKLQDEGDSHIYPHENTHSKAKEDRYRLWSLLKSNLSAIFVCFSDTDKTVEKIFNTKVSSTKPFIDLVDDDRVRHILWRLDDPALISQIVESLADQQLFIADGHHRYEVAQQYRNFRLQQQPKSNGQEPFHYVMTYFTNMDSKNLEIFPMHRIVKKFPARLNFLEEFFRMDKIKTKEDLSILLAKAGKNEHAFGVYSQEGIRLLRLKNKLIIDQQIQEGSKEYRRLDATILKCLVFDRVGVKSEDILYTKDINQAFAMVDNKEADVSFTMNPVTIQQLKSIALNGERMPPKTTYFYPKILSGLTVYKME